MASKLDLHQIFQHVYDPATRTLRTATVSNSLADEAVTEAKIASNAVTADKIASGLTAQKLADGSVSDAEFQYLSNVSSDIQGQFTTLSNTVTNLTNTTLDDVAALDLRLDTLEAAAVQAVIPTEAGAVLVENGKRFVTLTPAGPLAAYTITLPAIPANGQTVTITCPAHAISAVTLEPSAGHTLPIGASITSLPAYGFAGFLFNNTIWYRVS